jgi:serine/threonine-protein kinase RsbW
MRHERVFANTPSAVGRARRFVVRQLDGVPGAVVDEVAIMVSELATNCVRHTVTDFTVGVEHTRHEIVVEVTDRGGGMPTVRRPEASEPSGRGLRIVQELADSFGVRELRAEPGKTVWFVVALDDGAEPPTVDGHARLDTTEPVWSAEPVDRPGGAEQLASGPDAAGLQGVDRASVGRHDIDSDRSRADQHVARGPGIGHGQRRAGRCCERQRHDGRSGAAGRPGARADDVVDLLAELAANRRERVDGVTDADHVGVGAGSTRPVGRVDSRRLAFVYGYQPAARFGHAVCSWVRIPVSP